MNLVAVAASAIERIPLADSLTRAGIAALVGLYQPQAGAGAGNGRTGVCRSDA